MSNDDVNEYNRTHWNSMKIDKVAEATGAKMPIGNRWILSITDLIAFIIKNLEPCAGALIVMELYD